MRHYHCPVNAWDCPEFLSEVDIDGRKEKCVCNMTFEDSNPYHLCDDFYGSYGDEVEEEEYTDFGEED